MRSPGVRLYVSAVTAVAVVSTAALVAVTSAPLADRPLLVAVVAVLIAVEHLFATRVARGRQQGETTTHEETYIVFLALVEPATAVVAAIALGFFLGSVLARRAVMKAVFNVAAVAAAAACAMLATVALGGSMDRTAAAAGAAVAGAGVYAVVNLLFLSGVLAVVGAGSVRATFLDDLSGRLLLLGTNVALGLLAGLAARESVWALPFALLALVVLHFTLAGHGRARAERQKLRDVIDASSDGILVVDDRGDVVSWSAACTDITGYAADEVCGRPLRHVRRMLDAQAYDNPAAEPGQRYAARIRTKAGELRWLLVSRAPLPEGGDLLVAHDDTARRALEELRAAQFQERARADLIAAVSHEFRTPLTSILGFTETLLRRRVPEGERDHYLTIVHEQAARLERLVDDLLDLRAIDAGALQLEHEPFDLVELARREAAAFETGMQQRSLQLVATEPVVMVRADVRRIEQVVANLLSNALKYSPEQAPVTVTIAAEDDHVRVRVRDEGSGISPEHHENVFAPFFRIGGTDAAGTGLGLAIARQIVVLHGGTIGFTSVPGAGSEFFFTLPYDARGEAVGSLDM